MLLLPLLPHKEAATAAATFQFTQRLCNNNPLLQPPKRKKKRTITTQTLQKGYIPQPL
jgi:hypothetical protein